MITRLRLAAAVLRRDSLAVWLMARHPRTPWTARLVAALTAAYAFSPVDLIPDFIPVLGLLDDLLIVPAGIWLAIRLTPRALLEECRRRAGELARHPVDWRAGFIILLLWGAAALWLGRLLAAAFRLP